MQLHTACFLWLLPTLITAKINTKSYQKNAIIFSEPTKSSQQKTLDGVATFALPFHVSVQAVKGSTYEHLCGGTIIHEQIIVTAAHCFHEHKNPKEISIVAGSNRLSLQPQPRQQAVQIQIHEHFVLNALGGRDIALVKLKEKFKFDGVHVDKLNFNVSRNIENATDGYLLGWGEKIQEGSELELISFRTLNSMSCRQVYGYIYVSATDVCGISHQGRGACTGDSGGPLVSKDFNLLYGLLSYGKIPCQQGAVYVFTSIYPLQKWIVKNMDKLLKSK